MKTIFKKIFIVFIVILIALSFSQISKAIDDEQNDTIDMSLTEILQSKGISIDESDKTSSNTNISDNLFEMIFEDYTVNSNVEGDAFILCGETVNINSRISGNLFVCAKNVVIGDSAQIESSLFCMSQKLTINGNVEKNVYSVNQDFSLSEYAKLGSDLFLAAQNIDFKGTLSRDAYISCESMQISENAKIIRNLNYSSEKEAQIPEDVILGQVHFNLVEKTEYKVEPKTQIISSVISCIRFVIVAIVLFFISTKIDLKYIEKNLNFKNNIGKYILFGLLSILVTPIALIFLIPFSFTLTFIFTLLYIIMLILSTYATINLISIVCADKLKEKFLTQNETLRQILIICIICIAFKLLQFVPIIGGLLSFASTVLGAGILVTNLFPVKTNTEK